MKIEVWITTNKVGSKCYKTVEIDDEDLDGYEGDERDRFIDDFAKDELDGLYEWGWSAVDA